MAEKALPLLCSAVPGAVQEGSECWGVAEQAQWAAPLLFSGPACFGGRQQLSLGWKDTMGIYQVQTEEHTVGYRPEGSSGLFRGHLTW